MSSGQKNVLFNTRERALSTDHNRLQAFIAADRSEAERRLRNDKRQNYLQLPGVAVANVGTEAPLAAEVFGGLMVDPQVTSLLVTPGVAGCLLPDPGATLDDSPYLMVNDPGLQTVGVLTFSANAGPGVRVDLVECQPTSTILESDSRDIFNPSTGLFTPAFVTKVSCFRMTYRIRQGVQGAGCPAPAAGWLPLAAIVVGTTATDFNGCDFYDVRPLVEDRVRPQLPGTSNKSNYRVTDSEFSIRVNSGAWLLSGYSLSSYGNYLAGGVLMRGTPSFSGTRGGTGNADGDPPFINLSNTENRETGFAHTADQLSAVCAFFPQNLPRWVRYSQTAIGGGLGRVPRGPRGVVCLINGDNGAQTSQATRTIPVFGACDGVVLAYAKSNNAGSDFCASNCQDGWQSVAEQRTSSSTTIASNVEKFVLTSVVDYPTAAKELMVTVGFSHKTGGGPPPPGTPGLRVAIDMLDVAGVLNQRIGQFLILSNGSTGEVDFITIRFPLPARPSPFDIATESFCTLQATTDLPEIPFGGSTVVINGWKL